MRSRERWWGWGILAACLIVAIEAFGFRVSFPTDPVGPRAFPLMGILLVAMGSAALLGSSASTADADGEAAADGPANDSPGVPAAGSDAGGPADASEHRGPEGARAILAATSSLVAYALVLVPLGFVVATAAEFTILALLFGGRWTRALPAGIAVSLLLQVLFVYGLGLPLPVGALFS